MRKLISAVAATVALLAASLTITTPAHAQLPAGSVTCEARSYYAVGVWTSYDGNYSCARALQECAYRTPAGFVCTVSRWWFN